MARSRKSGAGRPWGVLLLAGIMLLVGLGLGYGLNCRRSEGKKQGPPAKPAPAVRKPAPPKEPRILTPKEEAPPKEAPRTPPPVVPKHVPQVAERPEAELPKMAIVIDDLGYAAPEMVTRLCAQPIPLSVAVLPFLEYSRRSAELAHDAGKEVLLHLPMEPLGYPGPGKDPGPGAIMANLSEGETRLRVRKALLEIPFRKGVNNHMGSRITPDRARMTWVLEEVKARGGFFLDSRTEKDSVAFDVAVALGMRTVQRKVFLDDDKSFAEMERQWQRALDIARREGQVVVIGHIYPETLAALERLVPRTRGTVHFVTAGTLATIQPKGASAAANGMKR